MRYLYALLLISLLLDAFLLAPKNMDEDQLWNLILGNYDSIDPALFSVFMIMGVFPILCASHLLNEKTSPPYWPFLIGSFFLGCFAILPFLTVRKNNIYQPIPWLQSKYFGFFFGTLLLALLFYGTNEGDLYLFVQEFQHDRFVHIMSLDFLAFILTLSILTYEDLRKRETDLYIWSYTPLIGPIIWLCMRDQFPINRSDINERTD